MKGKGSYHFASPTPTCPQCGSVMYIWGWAGQGAVPLLGSPGLWGGPGPAPRAVNVFRVGGREMDSPVCLGQGGEGPPTWPRGSVVFSTCPPLPGWERLCGGRGREKERGWACCGYCISSPSPRRRAPNSVTYCVPAYLFVVNI